MNPRASTQPRPERPPSVDALLRAAAGAIAELDRIAVVVEARRVAAEERALLAAGNAPTPLAELAGQLADRLAALGGPRQAADAEAELKPAINATGVILHTNLGRAAWPAAAIDAARRAAEQASFLELDVATGRRGRRFGAVEDEVIALTGGEAALITNNNAGAVALVVGLAGRGGVAVSRGELVEIGGGVRIPEIVRRAGARLVEVGTTNRTRVADFEAVLVEGRAKVVLRVHPSNFTQAGFVEAPDARELAAVSHAHGAIVVDDLGSGALLDTARFGLAHEPTPRERLDAGADLVTFSGDKLVGGPQAGIIAGHADLVERLRRDPLARAMRPDKVVLAALAATLRLYRGGTAHTSIPIWRQIGIPAAELQQRAVGILERLASGPAPRGADSAAEVAVAVGETESTVGGGSLPGQTLPSWGIVIGRPGGPGSPAGAGGGSAQALLAALRTGTPAVIARVVDDAVVLDLRTVEPGDDDRLAEAIRTALDR